MLPMMLALAQDYDPNSGGGAGVVGAIFGGVFALVYFAVIILMIASMWKIFVKAGEPGWAAIVPIYNLVTLLKIVGRPIWWIVLLIIPCVNIVVWILLLVDLAKSFGKAPTFAAALIFVVGFPMLAFGDATYRGPAAGAPAAV
jgi:hypothetical protein